MKDFEVVVVDSSNHPRPTSIEKPVSEARFILVHLPASRTQARLVGARRAQGKFLLFLDSDMVLMKDVLAECYSEADLGYDALVIPEVSFGEGYWSQCKRLERALTASGENESARFFRTEFYWTIGGHDASLLWGEDKDLDLRAREVGHVGSVRAEIYHNEGRLTPKAALIKKYRYGRTFNAYRTKHPQEARSMVSLRRSLTLLRPSIIRRDPFHYVGMLYLKLVEYLGFVAASTIE